MKRIIFLFFLALVPAFGGRTFNGTSDFIDIVPAGSELSSAAEYTIALRFKVNTNKDNRPFARWDDGGSFQWLIAGGTDGTWNVYMHEPNFNNFRTRALGTISTGTWHGLVIRMIDNSGTPLLDAWIDGVKQGGGDSNAFSTSPGGDNMKMRIGAGNNGTSVSGGFDGDIAECGFWRGSRLSDAECAMVSKGRSPLRVHVSALTGYWPLIGRKSTEVSPRLGSVSGTITGTTRAPHPRVLQ